MMPGWAPKAYPEPSNHCLKAQKQFTKNFLAPGIGRNLSDLFLACNNDCSVQDNPREPNLVSIEPPRNEESETYLNFSSFSVNETAACNVLSGHLSNSFE
jgi:hypothetical protein